MKSILNLIKFKLLYLDSCVKLWFIKETIKNIDAKYSLQLSYDKIDKLAESYYSYAYDVTRGKSDIEDFVFAKMYYV